MVWGHAVSKDLIHWLQLPLAMDADQWYDKTGTWGGSPTILPDGKIVLMYTGSTTDELKQVINLAYPADQNDPLLLNWIKYPGNPVLFPPPEIIPKYFRDPTTSWHTSEGKWQFVMGSKVDKTGTALVYDTEDFINFKLSTKELHSAPLPGNGMWECLDFYPVSKTDQNGLDISANGPEVKHVIKASIDDHRYDYHALGAYDDKTGAWYPDNPEIDVGKGLRYNYGVFYQSRTFYDQTKDRRVLLG